MLCLDGRRQRRSKKGKQDEECKKKIQTRQKKGWSHFQCLSSSHAYNLTSLRNLINQSIILSSPVCYLEMKSRLKRESVCMRVRPLSFLSPSNHPLLQSMIQQKMQNASNHSLHPLFIPPFSSAFCSVALYSPSKPLFCTQQQRKKIETEQFTQLHNATLYL